MVGGGPAGLIAALQLANHGIRCTLVERNANTTDWPKMDITNCRSMELLRRLGVADSLGAIGRSTWFEVGAFGEPSQAQPVRVVRHQLRPLQASEKRPIGGTISAQLSVALAIVVMTNIAWQRTFADHTL